MLPTTVRREAAWLGEAASDDDLTPDTRVALAAALRTTDPAAAGHACAGAESAARLLGAADRGRAECGYPRAVPDGDVRGELDAAAVAEGRGMNLDEAVAYARRARGARPRLSSGWASLTTTEREVVRLAVAGLNNPEIAKRLFMSRSTVKTHLAHVYAKLGVANRTELASVSARSTPGTEP